MYWIKGVYEIPSLNHVFLVVADDQNRLSLANTSQIRQKKISYFDKMLQQKDNNIFSQDAPWKVRVLREIEFLAVLNIQKNRRCESLTQSFSISDYMDMLAMNLVKTSFASSQSLVSPKMLDIISDDDVIEVFI